MSFNIGHALWYKRKKRQSFGALYLYFTLASPVCLL
jgi:hypothetical protein